MCDRLRRAWLPVAVLAFAGVTAAFWWLVAAQSPKLFYDSTAYIEAANRPWSAQQLFYPKPLFVSLVYRWIGTDAPRIAWFQEWLAFVSWTSLGIVVVCALRTRLARVVGSVVAVGLLLAPLRLGYADAVLSESINDSLMALGLALAVALCTLPARVAEPRRRWVTGALSVALIGVLAMWSFTRDTNTIVSLCGIILLNAAWLATPDATGRRVRPWRIAGSALVAAQALLVIWSTTVIREPVEFSAQPGWAPELMPRPGNSVLNNLVDRVLPDPDARAYFVERGLPQAGELAAAPSRYAILTEPKYVEARRWIAAHGYNVWVRWLLTKPIERLREQVTEPWMLLGVSPEQTYAMPAGWVGRTPGLRRVLAVATHKAVLLALIAAFPLIALRLRRDPRIQLAVCLAITGWIGSLAAFHADTAEPARHCYGSGQQVICGLFLAALAGLDAWRAARAARLTSPVGP